MRITRLAVEQLRQFRQPLVLDNLQPGLNLIAGPNESGKSTLVRAIRAAFFERHQTTAVKDLQPFDDSGAAPLVEIDFEHQGRHWQLRKRFLQRKRCDLSNGHEQFTGEAADDRLAELLGYQFPARGSSKPEHWGIPGLLWVEQGEGQQLHGAVGHASEHLQQALGSHLGSLASSAGDQLLPQLQAQLAELLTATGKPRGELQRCLEQLAQEQQQLQQLDQQIDEYREQVDLLARLSRQQQQEQHEQPWRRLRIEEARARERLQQVERLQQQQQTDQQRLEDCKARLALLLQQQQQQQRDQQQLLQQQQLVQRLAEDLQAVQQQVPIQQGLLESARSDWQNADALARSARLQGQREALQRELQQLQQQQQALGDRLQQAEALQQQIFALQQQLATESIEAPALQQLEQLQQQLREAEIRGAAIATRVQYRLLPGQQLQLDGEALSGEGELQLLQAARLSIEGVGELEISPGGEDLPRNAREQQQTRQRLQEALALLGVESLAQARQRHATGRDLQQELSGARRLLDNLAPQGLPALQSQLQQGQQQLDRLQQQIQALPAVAGQQLDPAQAETQLQRAADHLRLVELELNNRQQALQYLQRQRNDAEQALHSLQHQLQTEQGEQRRLAQQQQMQEQQQLLQQLQQSLQQRQLQIQAARPDILEQDIRRFASSASQLEQNWQDRREQLIRLQASLQGSAADGLEERRAELAASVDTLSRRQQQLQRRAAALGLLVELISAQRLRLTRELQAPLQRHLNHYLQLLFADAQLEVDEALMPTRLQRGREQAGFDSLSFGAREQMGLISRLAYADLLAEAGKPTLIILDDALVHSDSQRLEQMKRILFDAAQRHQILLFSCHPHNWQDMGVAPLDLPGLRAVASGAGES